MSDEPEPWSYKALISCHCGGGTRVVNVRGNKEQTFIRRQRECAACGQVFTTYESPGKPTKLADVSAQLDAAVKRVEVAAQRVSVAVALAKAMLP